MDDNNDVQKFLQVHPKYYAEPVSDELIERYINVFPDILLKFWKEHGFGNYGNGWIQFINPDEYRETVNQWLMRPDDGTRIPFAISAFGDVFYWRHIYNPNPTEEIPEWVFDVAYFNPHYSQTGVCAYSMGEFFGEYCTDPEIIEAFKWPHYSGFVLENNDKKLFDFALDKMGVLGKNEMYFFVPALRLGGLDAPENLDKGNAIVHLDILFQLTGEESYDPKTDLSDFYNETEKLSGDPVKFDHRIEELKSELNENLSNEDLAYKNYMIAKLFDEYPFYHDSIQNTEEVRQRVKKQAKDYHSKAKELDAENAKYWYASFRSEMDNYDQRNWDSATNDLEKYYDLSGDEELYLRGKYDISYIQDNAEDVSHYAEKLYALTGNYTDLINAASFFQHKGQYETSMEINRRIFEQSEDYYEVKTGARGLMDCLKEQNKKDEALKIIDELRQKFPENEADIVNETGLFLRNDYTDRNRLEKAAEYFEKAAEKAEKIGAVDYDIANYYFNAYSAYSEKEDFEKAKTAIEKAIQFSDDPYYNDEKANLLYKMGLEDEAQATFTHSEYSNPDFSKKFSEENWQEIVWGLDSSVSAFDRKIDKIEAELEEEPANAKKQFLLGKLYENYPVYTMPPDEQDEKFNFIANAGFVALCEATDLEPENPLYQLHFAEFVYNNHYYLEMEDEARDSIMEDAYEFYIDHAENPYEGYVGLKKMALYKDDWENIIKYSKMALDAKPEMTDELLDLGNAYAENGQYSNAAQAFQEYLLGDSNFYRQLQGKQGLAITYIKAGEISRAETLLEDLAQSAISDQERYEVYEKAAGAFSMNEDFDNAIKFQEKAAYFAEKTGDMKYIYPTALVELSSYYEQKGNLKEAIALAQKNCNIRGEDYDFCRLGYLYKENNQPNDARTALKKALQINPDDAYSKELLDELGNEKGGGFFSKLFK